MKSLLAISGRLIMAQVAALPLSFLAVIAAMPVLRRLEASTGLELVGHSGPSDWVIFAIWAVISMFITATLLVNRKQHERRPDDAPEI